MKTTLLLLFCSFFVLNCLAQGNENEDITSKNTSPNIVYILADDLGYGDLGCYGQKKIETPNIDALAESGMLFTQHYAEPVCAPSRYALMTGKNGGHAYIRGNDEWGERGNVWSYKAMEENPSLEGQLPIPDSAVTVAEVLKKAGYTTALVGKWGLAAPFTAGIPNNQGFDYFFGFICQRQDHTYYPVHMWENTFRVPLNNQLQKPNVKFPDTLDPLNPENYEKYQQSDYAPKHIIAAALDFIDRNKQHPFFLYYASPLPHTSLQAPEHWVNYYLDKFGREEKPYLGGSYFPVRYPHATRAAMISLLDENVGKIVKKLKDEGVYENTIIVFMSDNGPTFESASDPEWFDSGGPFKSSYGWGKGAAHEGGIREPFIVSWPNQIKAGSKSDLVSGIWDFVPTISDLVGVAHPDGIQGISYLPTLLGNDKEQEKHDYLYWEFAGYGGKQAVRLGKWKAIRKNIRKGNMKIQLFNLEKDIQEQYDVADQYPKVIKKMAQIMKSEHQTAKRHTFRMKALDGED